MENNYPAEYDKEIYKKYKDLSHLNDEQLYYHYLKFGILEGRKSSEISRKFLKNLSLKSTDQTFLEIGPFDCPVISGENVKYFDVLNQEKLKLRAKSIGRNGVVPFINFIDLCGNLNVINEKFDVILSSHSIEHQIDFVKHLQNVEKLLNDGGKYIIICPDSRFCFDHFIKESTIADVLEAYQTTDIKHTFKSVIEHRTLTCHNDSVRHWNNDHGKQTIEIDENSLSRAIKEYNETDGYIDVHKWQFTPSSFKNIITHLKKLELIGLKVFRNYHTLLNDYEFIIILTK
jgi:SAM-dependent methyltransferase